MSAATRLIRERGLKQKDAARLFGTTQPRISELLGGHIDEFTIDSLVNMLAHAGAHVQLSIEFDAARPWRSGATGSNPARRAAR